MASKKPAKLPKALKTDSGEEIPVRFLRKNIKSWRLLLLTKPPKEIRVRDKNAARKLVFA